MLGDFLNLGMKGLKKVLQADDHHGTHGPLWKYATDC